MNEQTILDFVRDWRANNAVIGSAELSNIQLRQLAVDLQAQVQQLSVRPSDPAGIRTWATDANPIAYSGGIDPNNVPAYQAVEIISRNGGGKVYYISDTAAGRFINSEGLKSALTNAVGGTSAEKVAETLMGGRYENGQRTSKFGVADVVSLNDFVSRNLMSTAVGDVRILAPAARGGSVLATTEVVTLLQEPAVTHINGIPKEIYAEVYSKNLASGGAAAAESALLDSVRYSSAELLKNTRIGILNGEIRVSVGDFFAGTNVPTQALSPELADIPSYGEIYKSIGTNNPSELASWGRGANNIAVAELALSGQNFAKYGGQALGVGGGILAGAAAYYTGKQIEEALNNDDPAKAKAILIDFSAKVAGGWVAGAYAASAAGTILSPLLAAGPVGGAAYLLLTGTAALVGGYWGVEAVDKVLAAINGPTTNTSIDQDNFMRVTEYANGVRVREPVDSYTRADGTVVIGVFGTSTSSAEPYVRPSFMDVPDGQGGFTTVKAGSAGSSITQWSGEPGQSTEIRRLETTATSENAVSAKVIVNGTHTGDVSRTVSNDSITESTTRTNGYQLVTVKELDGKLISTLTDTPDGAGGGSRVIEAIVDGKAVRIEHSISAQELFDADTSFGGDFFNIDGMTIGGQAVNAGTLAALGRINLQDILGLRQPFTDFVAEATPGNPSPNLVILTGRSDWWNDPIIGNLASDTVGLISALRSGRPLPIATAGFNFASHNFSDPAVAKIAFALSGVSGLVGLVDSLEKGDLGRILIDGGGVARTAVTIYSNSLTQQMISQYGSVFRAGELATQGNAAAAEVYNKGLGADSLLKDLGNAIAVLNIINSLANGDIKGAVLSAVSFFFPVAGAILTAVDFFATLIFERKAQFEADGRFVVNADGVIGVELGAHNGGAQEVYIKQMNALLKMTQDQAAADSERSGQPMGIIAERLPTIFFKQDAMFLRYKDPLSGLTFVRTFDLNDRYLAPGYVENVVNSDGSIFRSPWGDDGANPFATRDARPKDLLNAGDGNQVALGDNFFDSLAKQFSDAVTASGAIAPMWEVATVNRQRMNGYQFAGYTTEEIAMGRGHTPWHYEDFNFYTATSRGDARPGNTGPYGEPLTEASQQTVTLIALDLNGDGVITTTKKETGNGVLFDVDNDGFAEETDWIGPRDGILVLDRNSSGEGVDGQINRGADLFNDTWVDGFKRKLTVLEEVDVNARLFDVSYAVEINAQDAVFEHLKVWRDVNGDGVAQRAEMQGLSQLGITSLNLNPNYVGPLDIGSFMQDGDARLMQSVSLQANAAGVATVQVGNSLLVEKEVGEQNLYATAVIDYGQSTDAAVRASHTHSVDIVHSNLTVTATDEVLDGQEDVAITVSVDQLLKNDRLSSGRLSGDFLTLTGNNVGGYAVHNSSTQTVTFTPAANFNGVASFQYKLWNGQEAPTATAYIDIAAVDDAPVIEVTGARRQASWKDLNLTVNEQGSMVYRLQAAVNNAIGQAPADPALQVAAMGYLGASGTSLLPDSVGVIGAAAGKLYFAALGQPGNAATQLPWVEVWVDTVGNPNSGTITVSDEDDEDNLGLISIGVDKVEGGYSRDGQFGNTTVIDNGDGTARFEYERKSLWSEAPRTYMTGLTESFEGTPVYVPAKIGPDDAFMLEIKQAGATPEETITTYKKVIVGGGDVSQLRSEDEYLNLVDGAFQPPANPEPFNAFPIVLDLNDNGFRFIAKDDSSAFYDLAGDGVRRATAWTSGQDALLAYDANNDGKISGKAEISFKDYLPGAATDLAGLAAFDTNADGVFSSADAQWGKFRVWQDKNEDGLQTADELATLAQRGITSINLTSNNVASSASGVTVHGVGSYTRIDGSQAKLADAQFAYTSETLASVKDDTVDLNINPVAILSTGGGDDAITGSANADKINAGTGNDFVAAGAGDDVVIGGAGNDQIGGGDGDDTLWGGKGADRLVGDAGEDQLYGGSGDDYLSGGDDDDELWGGTGNDVTSGGEGMDVYHFALGDGNDLIRDMAEGPGAPGMRIVLGTNAAGQSINPQNIQVEALDGGRGYILRFSATDSLTVQNMGAAALTSANVQLALADGRLLNLDQLMVATHVNHAPTLTTALTRQSANQGNPWTYTVPAGAFTDADAGDRLSLSATLANGDSLPVWMNFNATTRTFSGTPPTASQGDLDIQVVATDAFGLSVASSFSMAVQAPVNRAPTVANALTQKTINEDSVWSFTVPTGTFTDPDSGDTLSLSAKQANGDPLPSWLSFNAATRTFSGTPLNANVGGFAIKVVATDALGLSISSMFDVQVANTNDAPTVANALTPAGVNEDSAWTFTVPANTFADPDVGDTLSLQATLANGDPLPSWLSFNATTRTFSGTPLNANVGSLAIKVVATDVLGLSASSTFDVQVANTNDAPTVADALTQKSINEDSAWSFTVPANTFADPDVGDTLSLSATLANGDALPSWLSFNAATRTFSGTPLNANVGTLALKVVATDAAGLSASSTFDVQVANTNDAPTVNAALVNQTTVSGQPFSYAVPITGATSAFNDQDAGDVLTLSAKLANGTVLPSWLSFNAITGLFSGTPPNTSVGSLSLQVIATDIAGASVSSAFALAVQAAVDTGGPTPPPGALVGTPGKDVLTASSAYTEVWGLGDNDIINGFWGSTRLVGGAGNDTINAVGGAANVLDGGEGNDILTGAWGSDTLIGGEGNNTIKVTGGAAIVTAGSGNDIITGNWGDDRVDAGGGNNDINAAGGNNNVLAGTGNDKIVADWGNDVINAGDGNNIISAGEGLNLIVSGDGNDTIGALGINVVIAGAGNDKITLGWGNDWVQAGKGNDLIDAGGGANLFAFNKGDGSDTVVNSVWGADTISLGGGIKYADLTLAKAGDDLVVKGTGSDRITLKDWYKASQNRGIGKLQVLTAGGDFDAGSASALVNKAVTVFDFDKLVKAFDTARAATPSAGSGWAVSGSLSAAQLNATAPITAGYVNPWAALQAGTALLEKAPTVAINPISISTTQSIDQLLFAALNATGNSNRAAGWMQA